MEPIDVIILLLTLWGAYRGYQKGLLLEIVGVGAFIVALILGFKLLGVGMNLLSPYLGEKLSDRFMPYITFTFIFFPTIFLINRFGHSIRFAIKPTILGTFDSIVGAFVGVFTWVFGISTLLWLLHSIQLRSLDKFTKKSILVPFIQPVAPEIISKISDLIPLGGNFIKEFKDKNFKKEEDLNLD